MSIFLSKTSSIATATSGLNGAGFWKPSWKYMNTGFLRRDGVSGQTLGTVTIVSRILQQHSRVAVVGMVVVGTRAQHEVGIPLPDLADDLLAHLQRGQQLAVMVVKGDVFDADSAAGFRSLGSPPHRQSAAPFALVARVAVRHRDKAHLVPERGPFCGGQFRDRSGETQKDEALSCPCEPCAFLIAEVDRMQCHSPS